MIQEISDFIKRLENVATLMESGNKMFTTCFAFDRYAEAVAYEINYVLGDAKFELERIKTTERGWNLYVDADIDWVGWNHKFDRYANYSDLGLNGSWDIWTSKGLLESKDFKLELDTSSFPLKYVKIDFREKYFINDKLRELSSIMDLIHREVDITSPDKAIHYFEDKLDSYSVYTREEIQTELESKLSCVPKAHFGKNAQEIIYIEQEKVHKCGFDRFLKTGYDCSLYFYPKGELDKETAGMYLVKYVKELTDDQKDAFFKYIIIREKVEDFVKKREKENPVKEKKQGQAVKHRGRPSCTVKDCIKGDDKETVLNEMKNQLKRLTDGPSKAKYLNKLFADGVLSRFPSYNALKKEGMIDLSESAWGNAMKLYR